DVSNNYLFGTYQSMAYSLLFQWRGLLVYARGEKNRGLLLSRIERENPLTCPGEEETLYSNKPKK
ncbi:Unknown protein, partial [Striga hermonthica]